MIEAGLAAFLENGFAGTSINDVARRADLAKGTAYLHFADKNALFAEVLRNFVSDVAGGRRLGRPRPHERTDVFLRRVFLPILRDIQAQERFRVLYLVAAEGSRVPELAEIYRRLAIEPVLRLVRILAGRAARRGELRAEGLQLNPILLAAPVVTAALWNNVFSRGDPIDVARLFEDHLDLLFGPLSG